ncbi:MAG: TIGR03016 family PEP-CTERM system-associated outer membrane protein, partial [Sulfurimicrobium sp.]|nr:TIGR03016 family PEP-CTERM system-associated outer membrane protein [Sulfurimicrobium sp.]
MATTTAKIIKKRHCRSVSLTTSRSAMGAMLLLSLNSIAADWKITPSLDLKETYSDNIRLASPGNEKSDFVTQINPGISLTGTGPRLKVNARYGMQNLIYAEESSRNTLRHQLNAGANAELLDDLLYLDGKASISQQNISTFGQQSTGDNINITD